MSSFSLSTPGLRSRATTSGHAGRALRDRVAHTGSMAGSRGLLEPNCRVAPAAGRNLKRHFNH